MHVIRTNHLVGNAVSRGLRNAAEQRRKRRRERDLTQVIALGLERNRERNEARRDGAAEERDVQQVVIADRSDIRRSDGHERHVETRKHDANGREEDDHSGNSKPGRNFADPIDKCRKVVGDERTERTSHGQGNHAHNQKQQERLEEVANYLGDRALEEHVDLRHHPDRKDDLHHSAIIGSKRNRQTEVADELLALRRQGVHHSHPVGVQKRASE